MKKMEKLDIVLLSIGIFLAAFIVTMIVIFCVKGSIPDTLVTMVLGGSGLECILTAIITIYKKKYERKNDLDGIQNE